MQPILRDERSRGCTSKRWPERFSEAAETDFSTVPVRPRGGVCYSRQLASRLDTNMIETNPILAQIADLRGRVESLRGYL